MRTMQIHIRYTEQQIAKQKSLLIKAKQNYSKIKQEKQHNKSVVEQVFIEYLQAKSKLIYMMDNFRQINL